MHVICEPSLNAIAALENVQRRAAKLIRGYNDIEYKKHLWGDMIESYKKLTGKYDTAAAFIYYYTEA